MKKCNWCQKEFVPHQSGQRFCKRDCSNMYWEAARTLGDEVMQFFSEIDPDFMYDPDKLTAVKTYLKVKP